MKSLALLVLLPLVAGCNVHSKNPDGDSDNVSIHSDEGGNVSFDLPFAKGQVKLPSSFMHEGDVDIDGVKRTTSRGAYQYLSSASSSAPAPPVLNQPIVQ